MLSERARKALLDIRDNILLAKAWTKDLSLARFTEDRQAFYAVTRTLEIISEASRRLPPELKKRHPEIAWRDMQNAGNIYRHDYDGVREQITLRTVREALPMLLTVVEAEIAASPGDA